MNIQQFAALKVGSKISLPAAGNGSIGTVTEISDAGVYVAWGANAARPFFYSVNSTAWFQWEKVEDEN